MAEPKNFSQSLEEMRSRAPEVYDEIVRWYGPADLAALSNDETVFNDFVKMFQRAVETRREAENVLEVAVETDAPAETADFEAEDNQSATPQGDAQDEETEAMLSDPYHWQEFYAPVPEEESKRFDKAYKLLKSEKGKDFQKTPGWKNSDLQFAKDGSQSLNEMLDICACRRLASSTEEINLQNMGSAREEESARIKVEYYNSLYAITKGKQYQEISAQKHIERVLKIDEAVRSGKSEKEIFKMLGINPNDVAQRAAFNTILHSNTKPLSKFVEKRKKFRDAMHSFGQVMDFLQKCEQNHPLLALGANSFLAGNVIYMGYRSVLSSRALYNDFQGFKDYAVFREMFKDQISEQGFKRWQEQNKESKITLHDYEQVKKYDSYSAYLEKHSVNHIGEDEFKQLRKFHKKQEFTREEFDMLRQMNVSYEDYAAQMKEAAVSKELFESMGKYADIRRALSYRDYAKKSGDKAVGEQEYNRVKALASSMGKISFFSAVKDKGTRKAMLAHSVIFARSIPVIGQTYALSMAVSKMAKKSYWQSLKKRVQGTGSAIKTLWNKKGRDKEAWKQLRSEGGGLAAEVIGTGLLIMGSNRMLEYGTNFVQEVQSGEHTFTEHAIAEIQKSVQDSVSRVQNIPNRIVDAPNDIAQRFDSILDNIRNLSGMNAQQAADSVGVMDEALTDERLAGVEIENEGSSVSQENMDSSTGVNEEATAQTADAQTAEVGENGSAEAEKGGEDVAQQAAQGERSGSSAAQQTANAQTAEVGENGSAEAEKGGEGAVQQAAQGERSGSSAAQQTANAQTAEVGENGSAEAEKGSVDAARQAAQGESSQTVSQEREPEKGSENESSARQSDAQQSKGEHSFEGTQPSSGTGEIKLNDEQKANLESLFKMYPRAATIILEGNENPSVSDITKGGFSIEGENKLYSSGVISSAKLQDLYENGKFSNEQMLSLSKFADEHFENGRMNESLLKELYGHSAQTSSENVVQSQTDQTAPEQDEHSQTTATINENQGSNDVPNGEVRSYSFDKDGNIIYQINDLQDVNGMDPESLDAKVYEDLLRRQSAGEKLDDGALKFLDSYGKEHDDTPQNNSDNQTKSGEPREDVVTVEDQSTGVRLHRRELENGKGYELYGSGEINGKQVDVSNFYDDDGKQTLMQYAVHEGEGKITIIKAEVSEGKVHTTVTEVNGDKTTTREIDGNPSAIMREILGEQQGQETKGLEESKRLDEKHGEKAETSQQTDTVRSSTFRGKYWIENDMNGMPQLHCRMSNPQSIPVDRELVQAFQSTIDGSGHNYHALGGLLRADNYGSEHRDNPEASGIRVKCEYLAQTIARNEAVYQDMEHRIAQGETLNKMELQWRQNYENDMEKIGLTREDGRLVYSPAYHREDILERGENGSQPQAHTGQKEAGSSERESSSDRKVYNLDERQQDVKGKSEEQSQEQKLQNESEQKPQEEQETTGVVEQPQVQPTYVNQGGFNGAYVITDTEDGYNFASKGSVRVDQTILNAVRPNAFHRDDDGAYTAANGMIKSENFNVANSKATMLAQSLTRNEAIYDHLSEESERRELTKGEQMFMDKHNETLKAAGLTRDENGDIVRKNENDAQVRKSSRHGRGYGD